MPKFMSSRAAAGALLAFSSLAAAPALAQSPVTFVSGKGTDAGNCAAPASPCRTFQYALGLTNAGGEIKALDPANYFSLFINKSINITGVDGAGILRGTAGNAITINAGASGVVTLSNLTIDGFNRTAGNGITVNSVGSLTIRNCVIRNLGGDGIALLPTTAMKFRLAEVVLADNNFSGLYISPQGPGPGSTKGVVDHVTASGNLDGVFLSTTNPRPVVVAAVDSVASDNIRYGFLAGPWSALYLIHSVSTRNGFGIKVSGGEAYSASNNFIFPNTINIDPSGALFQFGTQ